MPFAAQALIQPINQKALAPRGGPALTARIMAFPAPAAATAPQTPEDLLVAVGTRQDKQAFAALFDHFAPRLNGYMRKLGSNSAQAEELVQETMLQVWRKAGSFDPRKASAGTWIYTIARNKRIDLIRRERRPEYDPNDPALQPVAALSQSDEFDMSQHSAALSKAIATLPPEQADLLRLAYFEDKAHSEIAHVRQLPLGTVKSRLRLALEKLRRQIGAQERE